MTDYTNKVFRETYRDYYDKEDGYHRVLYNAGRALQARELTESQRIIHEEIARFGQNIFKEGAMVNPGGATVDNRLEYIRLDETSVFDETLVGKTLTNGTVEFKVLEMYDVDDPDPITLYVQYTNTINVTDTQNTPRVSSGDTLTRVASSTTVNMVVAQSETVEGKVILGAGKATKAYFSSGDFFVQGHFVYLSGGSAFIDKYSNKPTVDFGFRVEQNIITESEDVDLHDNQGEVPNLTSPGAHRYQIKLTPTTRTQAKNSNENFVFVARIVDGVITREVSTFDAYNRINDLMAQRTKEESGDYVVKKFKAVFEDKDSSNLNLDVTDGIAYVDGYRLEIGTTDITVPKARDTLTKVNEPVPAAYGNYVYIEESTSQGFGRIDDFGYQKLLNSSDDVIGYANVRGVQRDSVGVRLYLFNIRMDSSSGSTGLNNFYSPTEGYYFHYNQDRDRWSLYLDNVRQLNSSTGQYFWYDLVVGDSIDNDGVTYYVGLEDPLTTDPANDNQRFFIQKMNGSFSFSQVTQLEDPLPGSGNPRIQLVDSTLYETSDNTLLFPLPRTSPTVDPITANYTVQRYIRTNADNNGEISLTGVETAGWIISETDGPILSIAPDLSGTYTGLTVGQSYDIAFYVELSNVQQRTKQIKTGVDIQTLPTVDWEARPVETDKVDGIALQSVKYRNDPLVDWVDAEDITYQFTFDGGQRDNFYDEIVIYVKSGYKLTTGPTAEIQVTYSYYEHQGDGIFFSASSYVDDTYETIPNHTTATGQQIPLRDVLDFRPNRTFGYTGEFDVVAELPQNASAITINTIQYYLPRIDILVANATDSRGGVGFGELQVIQGESNVNPREPQIPSGSLALYKFKLNPYTFDRSDLTSVYIPNKRFTMKDIAALESRLDDLYEMTTLSLLESNTASLDIPDSTGSTRVISGFVADNFSSFLLSSTSDPNYRASVDPNGFLKPSFRENSVRLTYSSDNVDAVQKSGDVVTLPFGELELSSQQLATEVMNVNPHAVVTQIGHLELSPSSDEWIDTRTLLPAMRYYLHTQEDVWVNYGEDIGAGFHNVVGNMRYIYPRSVSYSNVRHIQDYLGERVDGQEVVPYMRSRRINFVAKGLRPNTKVFAFFGDKDVSAWVREETTTQRFADDPLEFNSQYANATEYPADLGGPSALQTDGKGELIGSFFLPNTDTIKFRTGAHQFKLLDVSVNNEDEATSFSRAVYSSEGSIENVQGSVTSTRVVTREDGAKDPLAQTFFVDQTENPNGLFLTSVDLYLESKDDTIPLQVQVRPVENGVPTTKVVPGAIRFIDPSSITVTPFDSETTMTSVQGNQTTVQFDEPIYLTSGGEYAIVLLSDSVNYNVYVAESDAFVVGSREDKVSRQAALGSLFLTQNGSTWSPNQNKDLMFKLNRAEFDLSGDLVLDNAPLPKVTLGSNPIEVGVDPSDLTLVKVYHEGHGFSNEDFVSISGVVNSIGNVPASEFNTTHTVHSPTWNGYFISVTTPSTSPALGGGDAVVASQQAYYDTFVPQLQTIIPNKTALTAKMFDAKAKSYGSVSDSRTANRFGYGLQQGIQNARHVFVNDYNLNTEPSVVASSENNNGDETLKLNLSLSTSDSKVSPLVDLQRVSVRALENVIDYSNAAQHITTPVTVDESSFGLKIIFGANRPAGSNFDVYVKTAVDEDALATTTDWVQVEIDRKLPTDDSPTNFREYSYTHESDQFTAFQVKIVMHSQNSSSSPIMRDLRAIALVTPF